MTPEERREHMRGLARKSAEARRGNAKYSREYYAAIGAKGGAASKGKRKNKKRRRVVKPPAVVSQPGGIIAGLDQIIAELNGEA
jgi:hypothetical protein